LRSSLRFFLPVFAQAKEAAKSTVCLSNQKEIGTGAKLYSNDYDDSLLPAEAWGTWVPGSGKFTYPPGISFGNTGHWPNPEPGSRLAGIWTTTIQPYLKSTDLLYCPSYDEGKMKTAMDRLDCDGGGTPGSGWQLSVGNLFPADTQTGAGKNGYLSHFAVEFAANVNGNGPIYGGGSGAIGTVNNPYYNQAASGWLYATATATDQTWQTLSDTSIVEPSRNIFLGEGGSWLYTRTTGLPRVVIATGCEGTGRHHSTGANYDFVDTHAKYIGPNLEDILSQDSSGQYYVKYMSYDK
jgi:hypothetical protein